MSEIHFTNSIKITTSTTCGDCHLQTSCLPRGLSKDQLDTLNKIILRRRLLKKRELLFCAGESMASLYAIREGAFKALGVMEDGRVHIVAFYWPGEILGMDAISTNKHLWTAEAIETSLICEIPLRALENLAQQIPELQYRLLRIMSGQIERDESSFIHMNAAERLASCLILLASRQTKPGDQVQRFRLSMSRQELGDYLGMAVETVSRLFARFQDEELISIRGRMIVLHDISKLKALANGAERHHVCV